MEISRETMQALEELSKINMEVSRGKAELIALRENLDSFLNERETLEQERIKEVLAQSHELVNEIGRNYEMIHTFYSEIASNSTFLHELHASMSSLLDEFSKAKNDWDVKVRKDGDKLSAIREEILKDRQNLEEMKKKNDIDRQNIVKEQEHLANQRRILKETMDSIRKSQ